jgi:hypothetical protein
VWQQPAFRDNPRFDTPVLNGRREPVRGPIWIAALLVGVWLVGCAETSTPSGTDAYGSAAELGDDSDTS